MAQLVANGPLPLTATISAAPIGVGTSSGVETRAGPLPAYLVQLIANGPLPQSATVSPAPTGVVPNRFLDEENDLDIDLNERPITAQVELMNLTESTSSGIETRDDSTTTPLINAGNLHQLGKNR